MFNYFPASVGAYLLHLATSNFLYNNGRVLGWSSILYNSLVDPNVFNFPSLIGVGVASFLVKACLPEYIPDYDAAAVGYPFGSSRTAAIAGLLTGFGTKWASGCTSGHMLSGISRLSSRSIFSTMTFTTVGMLTRFLSGAAAGCSGDCARVVHPDIRSIKVLTGILAVAQLGNILLKAISKKTTTYRFINTFYCGFLFGLGLLISGLGNPSTTLGFLAILSTEKFNPTLLMVIVFGILPNMIEYFTTGPKLNPNATVDKMEIPTKTEISPKLIIGSAFFGIAWGLTGICPGPGIVFVILKPSVGITWLINFLLSYYFSSLYSDLRF